MRRRNPYVESPWALYTGTSMSNAREIARTGITPSGGRSPHRTTSVDSIFLTDSMEGALMYAWGAAFGTSFDFVGWQEREPEDYPVIIELKTVDDIGKILIPDKDDVRYLDVLVDDLAYYFPQLEGIKIGDKIPEDIEDEVRRHLEDMEVVQEGFAPSVYVGDEGHLVAAPTVGMGVDAPDRSDEGYDLFMDWYAYDMYMDQYGDWSFPISQYQCICSIPASNLWFWTPEETGPWGDKDPMRKPLVNYANWTGGEDGFQILMMERWEAGDLA